jgi:hypothetical protein
MKVKLDAFIGAVKAFAPLVLLAVPGGQQIAQHVGRVTDAIIEAEQIAGATGPEKKAHVQGVLRAGVLEANATGKVHLDPAEAAAVADKGIDTVIAVLHLVHGARPPAAVPGAIATAAELGVTTGSAGE